MTAVFIVLAIAAGVASAFDVPPYSGPVNDQAGVLSQSQKQQLSQKILDYRNKSGNEIGVLIIKSLDDNALEDVTTDVFKKWGIGKATKNNGVLFLVAIDDHKARVEVGYGLEGDLTDLESGRLVSRKSPMADAFRKSDFAGGVSAVIDGIIVAIGGDYKPAGSDDNEERGRRGFPIAGVLFFGLFLVSMIARSRRGYRGGPGGWWMGGMGGLGGLGGFGGGRGGGGGFSFGGGSSGGGGASGGW